MLNSKRVVLTSLGNRKPLKISYGFVKTPFGRMLLGLVGDENDVICFLHFAENASREKENNIIHNEASLQKRWPDALLSEDTTQAQRVVDEIFSDEKVTLNVVVAGTPFQEMVWKELLNIRSGQTSTYGDIAERIGNPKAVQAVGTAVGSNDVCIVIPCHRVISKNGDIKYGGGKERKISLLKYEYEKSVLQT